MAVPVHTVGYVTQDTEVGDGVSFDLDTNWTGAPTRFEIHTLPPGFTQAVTDALGGSETVNMNYTIYVRAHNADGFSDWSPLEWNVTAGSGTRTLWGLSADYQVVNAAPQAALILIKQAPSIGSMFLNDIDEDGSAAPYDSTFIQSQILLSGTTDTQLRAQFPGWEIIVDTAA